MEFRGYRTCHRNRRMNTVFATKHFVLNAAYRDPARLVSFEKDNPGFIGQLSHQGVSGFDSNELGRAVSLYGSKQISSGEFRDAVVMSSYDFKNWQKGYGPMGLVGQQAVWASVLGAAIDRPGDASVFRGWNRNVYKSFEALDGQYRFSGYSLRAAMKGYPGVGTTRNLGPTFEGTSYLYPAGKGQQNIVSIKLTGGRRADGWAAAAEAGLVGKVTLSRDTGAPVGYTWHHVDNFNRSTGTATMQLVKTGAHNATNPHGGSVAQYQRAYGVTYGR
jgi:hypothetical protein